MGSLRNTYWFLKSRVSHADISHRDYRHYTVYEEALNYYFSFRLRKGTPERFEAKWVVLRLEN